MSLSRRGLFGLLAGTVLARVLPAMPALPPRRIVQELEFAASSSFQRYSGYEVLNISPSHIISAADFDWTHARRDVTVSGLRG